MENQTTMHQHSPSPVEEQDEIKSHVSHVIPLEIIVDIILRLPVKSLRRFTSVSKFWFSFITHPGVAKSHLSLAGRTRVLLFERLNAYYLEYQSIGGDGLKLRAIEFDHPFKYPNVKLDYATPSLPVFCNANIVGSCNGLVLVSPNRNDLYLFNPSIRECKIIRNSPFGYPGEHWDFHGFGFGYFKDDFKIVKACYCGFVYSLRTDLWKFVSYLDGRVNGPGVFLNGYFHWMCLCNCIDMDSSRYVIARFSFEDEVFDYMPAPEDLEWSWNFVVGVINSHLCVFHNDGEGFDDIWAMTQYGVAESWTKITLGFSYDSMKHLCVAHNGYDLLQVDGKLLLYSFEDGGNFTFLDVDGIPEVGPLEAGVYVESLVSPFAAFEF